jgi:VanZ family protein
MANLLVPNKFFWIAVFWTILVTFLCLESASSLPTIGFKIKNLDKIVHAIFHFVFTTLWFLYFVNKNSKFKKSIWSAFCLSIFFGILLEVCQQIFTTSRKSDFLDILANSTGAFLATLLIFKLKNNPILKNLY